MGLASGICQVFVYTCPKCSCNCYSVTWKIFYYTFCCCFLPGPLQRLPVTSSCQEGFIEPPGHIDSVSDLVFIISYSNVQLPPASTTSPVCMEQEHLRLADQLYQPIHLLIVANAVPGACTICYWVY